MASEITGESPKTLPRWTTAAGIGSLVGAIATSSCCVLPLVLFTVGASGAWIGTFVQLAPFQPYFIAATLVCLGCGYWSAFRSRRIVCAGGQACKRSAADRLVNSALVVSTALIVLAVGFNFLMPLLGS
jgi:mercuric ion transport protein